MVRGVLAAEQDGYAKRRDGQDGAQPRASDVRLEKTIVALVSLFVRRTDALACGYTAEQLEASGVKPSLVPHQQDPTHSSASAFTCDHLK